MPNLNNPEVQQYKNSLLLFDKSTVRKIILVANTSTLVLSNNPDRSHVIIVNNSLEEITLLFGDGNAVIGTGIPLYTKGSHFDFGIQEFGFTGRIAAISAASSELSVTECSF